MSVRGGAADKSHDALGSHDNRSREVLERMMAASCVRSNNWTTEEISTLIAMWSEREVQQIFDGKDKNTKAYARIGDRMKETGFERSATQIQAKLKNLRQSFHKAKDAITGSGASSDAATRFCPHFEALDAFLGTKPISQPHHLERSSSSRGR